MRVPLLLAAATLALPALGHDEGPPAAVIQPTKVAGSVWVLEGEGAGNIGASIGPDTFSALSSFSGAGNGFWSLASTSICVVWLALAPVISSATATARPEGRTTTPSSALAD